jgi:hypothetical protein
MADLEAVALVYFGLSPNAFLAYTPLEFDRLLVVKADEQLNNYKKDMERMRLQTFILMKPHLKNQDTPLTRFMPFEWDRDKVVKQDTDAKPMTEEDWEALDKRFPT